MNNLLIIVLVSGPVITITSLIFYFYKKKEQDSMINPALLKLKKDMLLANELSAKLENLYDTEAFLEEVDSYIKLLTSIEVRLTMHKNSIPESLYTDLITDVQKELKLVEGRKSMTQQQELEVDNPTKPPVEELPIPEELQEVFNQIKANQAEILAKLEAGTYANKGEVTALLDVQMDRVTCLIQGYTLIKLNPADYKDSASRMERTKVVLNQIDDKLDKTLQDMNEDSLKDFEVILRLEERLNGTI